MVEAWLESVIALVLDGVLLWTNRESFSVPMKVPDRDTNLRNLWKSIILAYLSLQTRSSPSNMQRRENLQLGLPILNDCRRIW